MLGCGSAGKFYFLSLLVNHLARWIRCVFHGNNKVHRANEVLKKLWFAFLSYLEQGACSSSVFFATAADLLRVTIDSVLKIFSFSDKKKVLDVFDRHWWDAACCSRMTESRRCRCSWLAVKWCSVFPLILWLYVWFLDWLFFLVKFIYFQVFHNFHIFTLNWYSQLFQLPFFLPHLEFSQHRMSVRKRRKAVKPIAVRQSNWLAMTHYLLSVYTSYEQNFSSRELRGIFWT